MSVKSRNISTYIKCLTFLFLFVSITTLGQVNSILKNINNPAKSFVIDQYQIDLPKDKRQIEQEGTAYQFAVPLETNHPVALEATPVNGDDQFHYLLKVGASGAYALNFTLKGLIKGDAVAVYVKNLKTGKLYGPFDPVNNSYDLTAFPVFFSNEVIVEIITDEKLDKGTTLLHRVGVTYESKYIQGSGDCNVDINCEEGMPWQEVKNAVVRIMYDNGWLCSGTLINNTRNDSTPYFLTANHCIGNDYSAANMVFYFKYESLYCDGPEEDYPELNEFTLSGATLKSTKYDSEGKLDFTLLEISEQVPASYEPYFAGWNATENAPGETVGIHHPKGDVKKICIDYDSPVTSHFAEYDRYSFWRIMRWDVGVTEGGSSGSGLFNANFQLVGTLTGGEADCDNPVNDYYLKFSKAFDQYPDSTQQLKYWLSAEQDVSYWYGWPLEDEDVVDEYRIGPNPVEQNLTVFHQNLEGNVAVKLWDIAGNLVWEQIYLDVSRMVIIEIPASIDGLHIIEVKTKNKTIKKKLIIN